MLQITLIDLVFSVDSLLTAIVLTNNMITIAIAYILSTLVMISLSDYTAQLIKYSTNLKIIAILFILIAGMYLILEGLHIKLPKGYLYFSLIFTFLIENINHIKKKICYTKKRKQF